MSTPHQIDCTCLGCAELKGETIQVADWQETHAKHLRRRGGEDFEREPYSRDGMEWIVCPCGSRLLTAKGAGL